jgi:hypothetical protein
MLAGCAALLTGIALLIRLPVPWWARFGLVVLWLLYGIWEISSFSLGARRIREIRVGSREVTVINRQGREEPARIMYGSVVLPRIAWLRLRLTDGLVCAELLHGSAVDSQHWRHLQILWCQGARSFGRPSEADTISHRTNGPDFRRK